MIDSEPTPNRKTVFTNFDGRLENHKELRIITPIIGEKICTSSQIKVKIKVKMPGIKKEKRNSSLFKSPASIQNIFFSPGNLTKKSSAQYYSPKKHEYQLSVSKEIGLQKKKFLPELKQNLTNSNLLTNIYSELLGFLIKVQVDYIPIYQKIDIHRKGKIEIEDFEHFFTKNYPGLDHLEYFQRLSQLNSWFSKESFVLKRNFLAICTGVMYKKASAKDFKSIFVDQSQLVLMSCIEKFSKLFKRFSEGKYIELSRLLSMKNFKDSKSQKSLQTVFSEPVDLQRFINCYPFFKWVLSPEFNKS